MNDHAQELVSNATTAFTHSPPSGAADILQEEVKSKGSAKSNPPRSSKSTSKNSSETTTSSQPDTTTSKDTAGQRTSKSSDCVVGNKRSSERLGGATGSDEKRSVAKKQRSEDLLPNVEPNRTERVASSPAPANDSGKLERIGGENDEEEASTKKSAHVGKAQSSPEGGNKAPTSTSATTMTALVDSGEKISVYGGQHHHNEPGNLAYTVMIKQNVMAYVEGNDSIKKQIIGKFLDAFDFKDTNGRPQGEKSTMQKLKLALVDTRKLGYKYASAHAPPTLDDKKCRSQSRPTQEILLEEIKHKAPTLRKRHVAAVPPPPDAPVDDVPLAVPPPPTAAAAAATGEKMRVLGSNAGRKTPGNLAYYALQNEYRRECMSATEDRVNEILDMFLRKFDFCRACGTLKSTEDARFDIRKALFDRRKLKRTSGRAPGAAATPASKKSKNSSCGGCTLKSNESKGDCGKEKCAAKEKAVATMTNQVAAAAAAEAPISKKQPPQKIKKDPAVGAGGKLKVYGGGRGLHNPGNIAYVAAQIQYRKQYIENEEMREEISDLFLSKFDFLHQDGERKTVGEARLAIRKALVDKRKLKKDKRHSVPTPAATALDTAVATKKKANRRHSDAATTTAIVSTKSTKDVATTTVGRKGTASRTKAANIYTERNTKRQIVTGGYHNLGSAGNVAYVALQKQYRQEFLDSDEVTREAIIDEFMQQFTFFEADGTSRSEKETRFQIRKALRDRRKLPIELREAPARTKKLASKGIVAKHAAATAPGIQSAGIFRDNETYASSTYFPIVCHRMIAEADRYSPGVVCWDEDGEAFLIDTTKDNLSDVIANFFKHGCYQSLRRQLNCYGFKKTSNGLWRHSVFEFKRDSTPDTLLQLISRKKMYASTKSTQPRRSSDRSSTSQASSSIRGTKTSAPEIKFKQVPRKRICLEPPAGVRRPLLGVQTAGPGAGTFVRGWAAAGEKLFAQK